MACKHPGHCAGTCEKCEAGPPAITYGWQRPHFRGAGNPAFSGGVENYVPEPNSGCWLWLGYVTPNGYGRVKDPRRARGGPRYAHRVLFEIHRGEVPGGMDLDHICRVRSCVNPNHLEPVTRQQNLRRGAGTREENRWTR